VSPWREVVESDGAVAALLTWPTQRGETPVMAAAKVGRCGLTLSNPALKLPGINFLKPQCDTLLSNFAFKFIYAATPWPVTRSSCRWGLIRRPLLALS
jgi:hypothetical protein